MSHAKGMLGGIFVGGASRRMGRAKALLRVGSGGASGEVTLLERSVAVVRRAGLEPVPVGRRPELPELGDLVCALGVPVLDDAVVDAGPLGGLVALLEEGQRRAARGESDLVVALSCDLPAVQPEHLVRLIESPREAAVVAARRDGRWEPLAARYSSLAVLPIARQRLEARELALQGLLDAVGTTELARGDASADAADDLRWLEDWDTPADVLRSHARGTGPSP